MSDLVALIRTATSEGRLSGLSLHRDMQGRWQANAPSRHPGAWSVHIDADPIVALTRALDQSDPAPQPSSSVFD